MKKISHAHFFIWIGLLMNALVALSFPSLFSSLISTLLYIFLATLLFKEKPIAFLLFSPIMFLHFSVLISLNAIESGALMKEMGRVGYPSTASAAYSIVVSVFLLSASSVFSMQEKSKSSQSWDRFRHPFVSQWIAPLFVSLAIFYLVLNGAISGFPLIEGFDRFAYRRSMGDPIMLNLLNFKIVIASFLGLSAANCNSSYRRVLHHIIFSIYLLVSFLFADKFFIIIVAAFYYLSVQVVFTPEIVSKQAKRFFIPGLFAILTACLITIIIYSGNGSNSLETTFRLLAERFAEQGQLWFVSFNEQAQWIKLDVTGVKDNFYSLFARQGQEFLFEKRLGAFYFMQKYAPYEMYSSFIRVSGLVSPTMAFEPYGLELFGYLGLLVLVVIAGSSFGLIARLLIRAVTYGNPFNVLLPSMIVVQFYYLIVSGSLFTILGISAFKINLALLCMQIAVNYWLKRSNLKSIDQSVKLSNKVKE